MVNFPECSKCHIKILFEIQCYDINTDKKETLCEDCWKINKANYQQLIKEGKSVLVDKGKYDQNGGYQGVSIGNCKTCQKWSDDFENRNLSSFCSNKCKELEELKILQSRKDYSLGRNNSPGRPLDSNEKQRLEDLKRKYNNPSPHNPSNNNPNQPSNDNSNNFNWTLLLIVSLVLAVIGIGAWLFMRNKKLRKKNDPNKTIS